MSDTTRASRQSRRGFLQALGAMGAAAVLPGTAEAAARREELATLHDLSRCIGCGACVTACRETNARKHPNPQKPFPKMLPNRVKVSDWSERRDVTDRLTPYNWLTIQSISVEHAGRTHEIHIPRRCMHCQNPPCANLCPWGAARKQADGIVRIEDDACMGGSKCRSVCPWMIPQRQTGVGIYLDLLPSLAGNGVMFKCDRCYDRIEQGQLPACVEICPLEVQKIGPREKIVARAHELAERMGGYLYGETENGGTNTIYVSPVPFEKLDAALDADTAQGRPHLGPAPDRLGLEQKLAWAFVAAPLAGLAAGLRAGRKKDA
ncbi:MAG: 4Fe-4S dicluster domain-containing protein [Candidatus Eisenbacteria bacterium]|nr:4Fe-4S dicluster domain-containing protein [Candidatus Eisenbacteria bacterium]